MKSLFILFQHLVPQHLLSRLVGKLAECRTAWLKNLLIRRFISHYGVNMTEALQENAEDYPCFNAFFTRPLKPGMRPADSAPGLIVSPADGVISAAGDIQGDTLFQAKGKDFSLTALVGGSRELADEFRNGSFATVYLSPRDYHRVHMPLAGTLRQMVYVPGKLFSVNKTTSENIDSLFARNERAVCIFDTEAGPVAVILVGAMIVAGIETVWAGQVAPSRSGLVETDFASDVTRINLARGEEMGRFKLGSTVILLFGPDAASLQESLVADASLRMGETIGQVTLTANS